MSATMIKEFRLPDLGEGLTESEILSWKVGVGDTVTLNQVIAEVETAKAVVELPSPFAGVIKELHEQPGSVVEVGKPIVSFEVADDGGGSPSEGNGRSAGLGDQPAETPKREPNLVGYGAVVEGSGRPTRRARNFAPVAGPAETKQAESAVPVVEPVETTPVETRRAERPRSTPPVRKLAKDLGLDLAQIRGTGPGGLITREDVQEFAGQAEEAATPMVGQAPAAATAAGERETRTPIKGVRKHTAAAMVQSAFTAPHATEFLTVDVTPSLELLAKLKESRAFAGIKLTPLTLAAKAVLIALRRHPALNSRWDEENQEIVTFHYVNLGIAAATPRGLTVPNIKDAGALQLPELAQALAELAETARAGKTTPADLSGGTISITNIGVFGIDAGTPILNPGEAAILGLGAVRTMPWEYRGEVALRQVLTLSLSFDHRLVDGEQGSRFLADVGAILAEPGMVLTMV
ncbi:pyruvate dehydrogenase E2 component (dihydrolipoamide acetyltransferase) [Arthrobacter oryzae]|uniref:dihydrolipoamide acetyltransferase family protein n=1 Tax=Arthrobacter TaxID=1663 RepID=UPI001F2CE4CD|nr:MULTISPECIES: dihydrolipoamide acetyltransferase family protein [Arthrobacter]MDP9988096.1 pyruvate dehydrogenase E2 component (dihydrolipoamide acetyltransferase) [Arthrobacter oryzae]UKA72598.1 2-oxo acid dehydrogenase subunit E2 [Arthrobacter sp. FW306-06-A]